MKVAQSRHIDPGPQGSNFNKPDTAFLRMRPRSWMERRPSKKRPSETKNDPPSVELEQYEDPASVLNHLLLVVTRTYRSSVEGQTADEGDVELPEVLDTDGTEGLW